MSGWSRWLEICVAQALFGKSFSQMVAAIKKSRFRSWEAIVWAKIWYRPYHFVQLRHLERSRLQLSKYRSKVSILSSLAFISRFVSEEIIFFPPKGGKSLLRGWDCCLSDIFFAMCSVKALFLSGTLQIWWRVSAPGRILNWRTQASSRHSFLFLHLFTLPSVPFDLVKARSSSSRSSIWVLFAFGFLDDSIPC